MEHPQNTLLSKVQQANIALKSCTGDSSNSDILRSWMDLQRSVNVLYDSSKGLGACVIPVFFIKLSYLC